MEDEPITLNGRYKLLRQAGVGGMATVYKGQDLVLGRLVAVKVLHENLTNDSEFLRRFQKEAHAAANLAHPNIVTVHDIGQDRRRYYIVMEYVQGRTLKEVIGRHLESNGRPLPIHRALDLAIQICAGVGYAHRAGLIHCDVKPHNVLVTRDARVKVTDFGIARALSQAHPEDELMWGTPRYFSPEQAAGEAATPASDVYAIGVILFEMLAGQPLFEADSHTALAVKHMRETPPPITRFNPSVPQQLERIIAKVLSKEPAGRYRTADQLGRILSAYRQNSREETGPILGTGRRPESLTEEKTVFYRPPSPQPPRETPAELSTAFHVPVPPAEGTDWTAIVLGLLALVSLLGLIPLWYVVYLRYAG